MLNYVLGFAFSPDYSSVVLVKKERPDWMKGFWNGVGGQVEQGDKIYVNAMARLFQEETSVLTFPNRWKTLCTKVWWDKSNSEDFPVACEVFHISLNFSEMRKIRTGARWVPLEHLHTLPLVRETKELICGQELRSAALPNRGPSAFTI